MRSTSAALRRAINAQQTSEVFLVLLVIDHLSMSAPIRVVNNSTNVNHGGDLYVAFPFRIELPDERDDKMSSVSLRIDNVDQQVITELRQLTSAPTVDVSVVLASEPSTVEAGPFSFTLMKISYDANSVVATLEYEDVMREPIPGDGFTPSNFPGMFAGVS